MVTALRDYTDRAGFAGIALGLSGGIDSAVTAALATEAVAPARVLAVAMPAPESDDEETENARALAKVAGHPQVALHRVLADEVVPGTGVLVGKTLQCEQVRSPCSKRSITHREGEGSL